MASDLPNDGCLGIQRCKLCNCLKGSRCLLDAALDWAQKSPSIETMHPITVYRTLRFALWETNAVRHEEPPFRSQRQYLLPAISDRNLREALLGHVVSNCGFAITITMVFAAVMEYLACCASV